METATKMVLADTKVLEDPLAYLPCSTILNFRKGQTIYDQNQPVTSLFLVIAGKVKVSRMGGNGQEVLIDIYQADEFFGECALIGSTSHTEFSVAAENSQVMAWTIHEIETIAASRPKLAMALLQLFVQRSEEFQARIEICAVDNISQRLARALVRFAERFGHPAEDGSTELCSFTHEVLSQYVGTSREIITHYMNQFRKQGYLRYSRRATALYADAMKSWLNQQDMENSISPRTSYSRKRAPIAA
jgi:CRP/FNR family cyclic AMP-dependent transcriptional regulator